MAGERLGLSLECGRSGRRGNRGARNFNDVGARGVEIRLCHADLIVGQIVHHVGTPQEGVAQKNRLAGVARGEETPGADGAATVAESRLGAVLVEDGCNEFAEGDLDRSTAVAAKAERKDIWGFGKAARDDVAVVGIIDCANTAQNIVGDVIG